MTTSQVFLRYAITRLRDLLDLQLALGTRISAVIMHIDSWLHILGQL